MIAPDPAIGGAAPITTAPGLGLQLVAPPPANLVADPLDHPQVAEYDALNFPLICLAENLSDIEGTRIAMANRLRSLTVAGATPTELATIEAIHDALAKVEHQAVLALQRSMRAHPLTPWVKRSAGVGEKQAARLLAAIGNPYWNSLHDRPRRGPAELWAYCGYHVLPAGQVSSNTQGESAGGQPSATPTGQGSAEAPCSGAGGVAAKRRKGQRANWNANAKMRAFLIAESCMKASGGDYRLIYEAGRAKYAGLPRGHAHNRALRLVAKEILKDVYLEAKRWHEDDEGQQQAMSTPGPKPVSSAAALAPT